MSVPPSRSSTSLLPLTFVLVLTSALIVLRSLVFLHYEQADFDADQAIVGLMAKHLSEGRAWPLFFYGQLYMMGVQAWMAAPVFLVLGPTVFALKLPLLVINVVTGIGLVWLLVREVGLKAWQAGVAVLWFAALPPITASRMVQAQGGTIEPLFYALVLWLVRRRPIVFGLVFAFGFLQREFTLFAVLALLLLDAWTWTLFSRARLAHWALVLVVFLGAREGVGLLRGQASMFGPRTAPVALDAGVTNVDVVASSVCIAPAHVAGNVAWLLRENVPTFFGVARQPAGAYIVSARPTGTPWAGGVVLLALVAAMVAVGRAAPGWWRDPAGRSGAAPASGVGQRPLFGWFLLATGLLSLAGVAAGCNVRSLMTVRYHLLLALAPVGLTALAFVYADGTGWSRRGLRGLLTAATLVWTVAMATASLTLWRDYQINPPRDPFRILADDLVAHGDAVGWASYWVSYHVDFLSQEQVRLSPTGAIRINEYAREATRAGAGAITVGGEPCTGGREVAGWYVCR